jgi:hypothetical protein
METFWASYLILVAVDFIWKKTESQMGGLSQVRMERKRYWKPPDK